MKLTPANAEVIHVVFGLRKNVVDTIKDTNDILFPSLISLKKPTIVKYM